ncbi:MAG: response regulator, partial [Clostridiales bacterium]|nr:response regulator [Clostridiales bacterium]
MSKFTVFLADDEIVVREGIRSNFPWEETDFVLVGEAPDGEIALNMMQDIKPDILITDIRMPFMDGLALCRKVRETMPWVYMIILSGFDDFTYAKEAISIGVEEYLLKPVSSRELLEVLHRISVRIKEDKQQQDYLRAFQDQLRSSASFLKEKLLQDLLRGAIKEDFHQKARPLQMNLLANWYSVILLKPFSAQSDPFHGQERTTARSILSRLSDSSD